MHYPASHDPAAPRPKLAWFKVAAVGVTLLRLAAKMIQARSASEGSTYTRLRFGLVCRNCYPMLSHAETKPTRNTYVLWRQCFETENGWGRGDKRSRFPGKGPGPGRECRETT